MALIVSFEGLPNSGKSTASRLLQEKLVKAGVKSIVLDADNFGDARIIRSVANKYRPGHFSRALLYWFLHFQQEDAIEKFRESQEVIIVDRFWGSVSAIDGSSDIPADLLSSILSYSTKPDLTFFIDVPLEVALGRKIRKSVLVNNHQVAKRIEKKYHKLAEAGGWVRIDGQVQVEEVCEQCFAVVNKKLDQAIDYGKTPYCLTSVI